MPQTDLRVFLDGQVFGMTLAATAQRSRLYAANLAEVERKPFQRSLRVALETRSKQYTSRVAEKVHLENIRSLASDLSRRHSELLNGGRMKFGHAQKALNLYLKYLWCIGRVQEPPHCPVDSIILKKVPGFTDVRWTQLTTASQYMEIIASAKAQASASNLSLPQWELREYNRRDA